MNPHAVLLDALLAAAEQGERGPGGELTEGARADLAKVAALADDPEAMAWLAAQAGE